MNTAANPALRQLRRLFPLVPPLIRRYVNSFGRVTRDSEQLASRYELLRNGEAFLPRNAGYVLLRGSRIVQLF